MVHMTDDPRQVVNVDDRDAEDALCLWIGRVARAHVRLDSALVGVHQTLLMPSLGEYLTNRITSTEVMMEDCRLMVSKADIPEDVRQTADEALKSCKDANKDRNRVVHDMWLPYVDEEGTAEEGARWRRLQRKSGHRDFVPPDAPTDLTFITDAWVRIVRSGHRVGAVRRSLLYVLPHFRERFHDQYGDPDDRARWLAIMQDRFTLDGRFVAEVDTPA